MATEKMAMNLGVRVVFLFLFLSPFVCGLIGTSKSGHTNNWAVLVCTSRYWFNYRHVANTLSMYRSVKRLGIPDSQIILMLADDMACNARNSHPATVFNNANHQLNVYGDDIEVDYRGYEVTVENFIRVLTGRLPDSVPRSKRLLTDDRSNVLVYMTGHGGEGFLKFQDAEEISSEELGDAFEQMWVKRRYSQLLYLIDTCQAMSLYRNFYSPNIIAASSSRVGEDSLSHHIDRSVGVFVIDRWTYYLLEFLERVTVGSRSTLKDLFDSLDPGAVLSTPDVRTDLFPRPLSDVLITDFFGSVRKVEVSAAGADFLPENVTSAIRLEEDASVSTASVPMSYKNEFADVGANFVTLSTSVTTMECLGGAIIPAMLAVVLVLSICR